MNLIYPRLKVSEDLSNFQDNFFSKNTKNKSSLTKHKTLMKFIERSYCEMKKNMSNFSSKKFIKNRHSEK